MVTAGSETRAERRAVVAGLERRPAVVVTAGPTVPRPARTEGAERRAFGWRSSRGRVGTDDGGVG